MSVFTPCYTPYLLDRIKIRRIRRQFYKSNTFPDICIFRLLLRFNKANCLFVPRSIIHYEGIFLANWGWMRFQKRPNGDNRRLIVECFRLAGKQLTAFWDNKTTVGSLESSRKRFDCRCTSFFVPGRCYRSLDLKVNLVLIYKDQGFVLLYFDAFFLKDSRSSVSSYPLLGYG